MRAAVATFATDSPTGRPRSRYLPGGPRDSSQGGPTGSRSSARNNTSGVKKNSCGPARPRIQPPLRSRRLWQDEGDHDSLGQATECFSKLLAGFVLASTARLHSRHTTAIQVNIQPQFRFIVNRSRVRGTSSAPCLTRPTPANTPATFAMQPHLRGSLAPPLAEHSSRWSCSAPRGSWYSGADHAWVHPAGNGSRPVHRCDSSPTTSRTPRCRPDAVSHRVACAAALRAPSTGSFFFLAGSSFLRSCQRAMENRFLVMTLQPT